MIVAVLVAELYEGVDGTCVLSGRQSVKVEVVNEEASIARVNWALTGVPVLIPVATLPAASAGVLTITSGVFVVPTVQL